MMAMTARMVTPTGRFMGSSLRQRCPRPHGGARPTFVLRPRHALLQRATRYITYCYPPSAEESTAKMRGCLPSKELFGGSRVPFTNEEVECTGTGHSLGAIRC